MLRVLVVDDELLIRWSIAETLSQLGYHVAEAGSAKQALEVLSANAAPDVILLDYRMPDSNDLTLLQNIRRAYPSSAVIMMTAFGAPEMIAEAGRLGAYRVLNKPIEMTELPTLVEQSYAARSASSK